MKSHMHYKKGPLYKGGGDGYTYEHFKRMELHQLKDNQ